MKSRDLIKAIKQADPTGNLPVYWADHDHSEYEWNDEVGRACVVDRSKMTEDYKRGLDKSFNNIPEKYIQLRP